MKTTKRTVVKNKTAKIVKDSNNDDRILIIEEEITYSFTNLRKGSFFFKRSNGKEDVMEGKKTIHDIDSREREMILQTRDYAEGWVVEENNDFLTDEEIHNKNSMNDSSLKKYIEKNKNDIDKLKGFVDHMTSEFAVKRFKTVAFANDMASSLVAFCDYKLKQIEEEFLNSVKAPTDDDEVDEVDVKNRKE